MASQDRFPGLRTRDRPFDTEIRSDEACYRRKTTTPGPPSSPTWLRSMEPDSGSTTPLTANEWSLVNGGGMPASGLAAFRGVTSSTTSSVVVNLKPLSPSSVPLQQGWHRRTRQP